MLLSTIRGRRGGAELTARAPRRRRNLARAVVCAAVLAVAVAAPGHSGAAQAAATTPAVTSCSFTAGGTSSCGDTGLGTIAQPNLAPRSCASGGCSGPGTLAVPCTDVSAAAMSYCQLDGQTCRYYGSFGEKDVATPGYAETSHSFSGSSSIFTGDSQAYNGVGITPQSAAEAVATAGTASWVNDTRAASASATVGTGVDWFGFGWDNASVDITIHYKGAGNLFWATSGGAAQAHYRIEAGFHQWKNQRTADLGESVTATPQDETQAGGVGGASTSPSPSGIQTVHVSFTSLDSVYAFLRLTTDAATNAFSTAFIPGGSAAISDFGGAAANGGAETTASGSNPKYLDYLYADWRFDRGVGC